MISYSITFSVFVLTLEDVVAPKLILLQADVTHSVFMCREETGSVCKSSVGTVDVSMQSHFACCSHARRAAMFAEPPGDVPAVTNLEVCLMTYLAGEAECCSTCSSAKMIVLNTPTQ